VGDLDRNFQVKLLRALESKEFSPVGSNRTRKSDFRIISATNRDIPQLVKKGKIREDFFYRIHIVPIYVPSLRARKEDLPLLIDHFMRKYSDKNSPPPLPGKIIETLYNYDWPGNIRELQNVLQRYITLRSYDFIHKLQPSKKDKEKFVFDSIGSGEQDLQSALRIFEKKFIVSALERNRWRRDDTAKSLKISRKTLFLKMKAHGFV
jgi:transcriptional regulator with PAS, ATPase and Fis domain